jgi:hypothetical protein
MVVSAPILGQREQHRLGDVEVTRVFARRQLKNDHKSSSNIGHMWSRFHNTFLRNLRMGQQDGVFVTGKPFRPIVV